MKRPELVNVADPQQQMVTLFDGRQVSSASEDWRAECEARHVLNLPNKPVRLTYLAHVEKRRGAESRASLEAGVMALWNALR